MFAQSIDEHHENPLRYSDCIVGRRAIEFQINRHFERHSLHDGNNIRFWTSVDVISAVLAHSQWEKSFERHAEIGLARLCYSQCKTTEAHYLLTPFYGWFTEGFDTADLKEAKGLLDELC